MKKLSVISGNHQRILCELDRREKEERYASGILTSETLAELNISINALPLKSQQLLTQIADLKADTQISELDSAAITLHHSRELSRRLQEEYQILKLEQKNYELQVKIDRNNRFLERLRAELNSSEESLMNQVPSPDDIHNLIKELKQKVASYEESCDKANMKVEKLSIPECLLPESLEVLISTLATLKVEAADLKQHADDITLAREAKQNFARLRR